MSQNPSQNRFEYDSPNDTWLTPEDIITTPSSDTLVEPLVEKPVDRSVSSLAEEPAGPFSFRFSDPILVTSEDKLEEPNLTFTFDPLIVDLVDTVPLINMETIMEQDTKTNSQIDSTSNDRVKNNVVRHEYRVLSDDEKAQMKLVKDKGLELIEAIQSTCKRYPEPLEITQAKIRAREAIFWAVNHITR